MEVFADVQQLCPCYMEHQEFQKVLELNDSGLEIYLHRLSTKNIRQGEAIESSVNSTRDVFILYNKKDVNIAISKLTLELENKHMRCSQCRNILEHVQELMQELKSIDRKTIIGVCDYCRKRALVSKKSFCVCDKIVKMFKSFKAVQTEDPKKSVKIWPSKTEHVRKDKPKEICAYSNLLINQDLISPAAEYAPEVQQMFYAVTDFKSDNKEFSGTGLKTGYAKKTSTQPIKPKKTTFDYTPHEIINTKKLGTSSVESDTSLVKTNVGVKELARPIKRLQLEKNFQDTPSRDAKEELKRRHDLSLRQMMKHKKDSGFSKSKTPDVYGIKKVASWEQKESTPKYHEESEMNIKKISKRKSDYDSRSSDYASKRQAKLESSEKSRNLLDASEPSKPHNYSQDKIKKESQDLEKRAKDVNNLEDSYFTTDVKLGRSAGKMKKLEQRGLKSKSRSMEAQFSYVFPKPKEKKIKKISVKSSVLIKNTREKLKERQQKLEQERKIKLSQEKKKPQAEEQTNVAEEQQKVVEKDTSRKVVLGKKRKSEVAKKVSISKPDQEDEIEDKSKEKGDVLVTLSGIE